MTLYGEHMPQRRSGARSLCRRVTLGRAAGRAAGRRRHAGVKCCAPVATPCDVGYAAMAGRLVAVYRGVYAVGAAVGPREDPGRRCWPRARTRRRATTRRRALRELIPTLPAVLHVTLTRGDRRSRPGLVIHRGGLEPADVTLRRRASRSPRSLRDARRPRLARPHRPGGAGAQPRPPRAAAATTPPTPPTTTSRTACARWSRRPAFPSRSRSTDSAPTGSTSRGPSSR